MGLPKDAFELQGGCHCGAIRYRISAPEHGERPLHHSLTKAPEPPSKDGPRMPYTGFCACQHCRRATGSVIYTMICCPISTVEVKVQARTGSDLAASSSSAHLSPWQPADKIFIEPEHHKTCHSHDNYMGFYNSSARNIRYFCSRCGTHLGFRTFDTEATQAARGILDLMVATLDEHHLTANDNLRPEKLMEWNGGVQWMKDFFQPFYDNKDIHPGCDMAHSLDDDHERK